MDTQVEFEFGKEGLKGFWVEWLFDEIFTASIKMDFDSDKNNAFSQPEIKEIEKSAFSNLINFDYFTYVTLRDDRKAVSKVKSFHTEIKKNRLIYRFFVPFIVIASTKVQTLKVAVYDESFYCDITFQKQQPVQLQGGEAFKVSYKIRQDEENIINYDNSYQTAVRDGASYGGITIPFEILLSFRRF